MKKKLMVVVALLAIGVGWSGCGSSAGGGGDEGGSSSISTIDQLPRATSPVVDSSAALGLKSATTGINLGSIGGSTFDADSSVAACELTMRFKESISAAAQGDLILCYVQNVMEANADVGVDLYDGEYHIFDLDFGGAEGSDGGPGRVRMRIVRDSGGAIADFEMFACGDSGSGSDEQSEYLHQTIDSDGNFTMTSKGFFGSSDGEGAHQVEVAGTLNSSGQFTSKTIEVAYTNDGAWGTGRGESTVTQGASSLTFDGYEAGAFNGEGGEGTYENRAYAEAQLIDPNTDGSDYNLQLLAIGDGAAHAILSGSWEGTPWSDDVVEGWNGDTTGADATAAASYISAVEDQTPVAAGSSVTIAFGEGETYDCAGTADGTVTVDQENLDAACTDLDLGHEWINCWEVTGQE